jgi:GntR family transcriptional regulator
VRGVELLSLHRADRRADRARQVRDLLRAELVGDVFQGGVLPDEGALMRRYACSRNALREALALLTREGLIERIPGAGTFASVRQQVNRHDHLQGLSEQLRGTSRVTVVPLEIRLGPAPTAVAGPLGLAPGEEVVYFERRLFLDGAPLSLWSSYLPARVGRGLLCLDLEQEFYDLIERHLGLQVGTGQVSMDAMVADHVTAPLLECPEGSPILHLTRFLRQDNGDPLELGFVYLRGDRIRFVSVLDRERVHS